jgi:signal transduction histidine kinase
MDGETSWVTVIWSMVAASCLTLAAVQGLVWWRRREARAHALFALAALGTALLAGTELWMMHAGTPEEFGRAVRWLHVPAWLVILPLVGFVRIYLRAGRPLLAWAVCGIQTLSLLLNFVVSPNLNYRVITGVRRIPWLGESVTVATGVPSGWMLIGQLGLLLWVIFAVDAALTVWRRGDHQKALRVGGSIAFFTLAGTGQAVLVFRGVMHTPITASIFFLGIILAMSYELSNDMFRAAVTGRALLLSQEQLALSQSEAQTFLGRLITAQDDERARLARALHDGLGQSMALLAVELDLLGQQPPDAPEQIKGHVDELASQVRAMSADVHRMAHGLHPAKLEQLGLAAAVSGHCRDVERAHQIAIRCECRDVSRWLPPDVSLCLYRVTQEALHNVVKHSGAKHVSVELTGAGGEMRLSISDDGKGFDFGTARAAAGLGLLSMSERVRLVHGRIEWRAQPGAGTRVSVSVPLPPAGGSE